MIAGRRRGMSLSQLTLASLGLSFLAVMFGHLCGVILQA